MSTVVVVTTNPLSAEDAAELLTVAGGDAAGATFHVAVPEEATSASMGAVIDDWELGVAAGRGTGSRSIAEGEANPGAVARHDAQQVPRRVARSNRGSRAGAVAPERRGGAG